MSDDPELIEYEALFKRYFATLKVRMSPKQGIFSRVNSRLSDKMILRMFLLGRSLDEKHDRTLRQTKREIDAWKRAKELESKKQSS